MSRIPICLAVSLLACGTGLARGDESSPPEPPTASLPAHFPITRGESPGRSSTTSTGSPGGFWLSAGGVAVAIAAFGFVSLGARKLRPNSDVAGAELKVIGRASLSPRQSVFLLKAGNRVLILGAGGQGPPSLLGELTDADRDLATSPDRKDGGTS